MTRLNLLVFTLVALGGFTAAFFRPAVPRQAKNVPFPRGDDKEPAKVKAAFVDLGLDNPLVESDDKINPSRKCGFCMG
eukprot:CAMPEP_0172498644 /NCGR_PEP_ID=MMETSP1066-20121228/115131_1 /TAXON_ID=671091 /ORGANISM="Coscinodiscus wailesii, Strain CCMP2513" /LENGTH=77 /DNA_ID=CAMNT_0013272005 /DNA_START=67 /DNA_END=300 /DNA_ORIENTATION=+